MFDRNHVGPTQLFPSHAGGSHRRPWRYPACSGRQLPRQRPVAGHTVGPDLADLAARLPRFGELTPREHQVATLVAEGFTNRQIAERLVIAPRTADNHVQHIFDKLALSSRAQLAACVAVQSVLRQLHVEAA